MSKILLAFDTGLATFGMAAFDLFSGELLKLGFVETSPSKKKLQLSHSSDTVRRARQVSSAIYRFHEGLGAVGAIAHESLSLPRNSSAAALIGISLGLVVHHATTWSAPVVEVSPQDLKIATAGNKSATKAEVLEAMTRLTPNITGLLAQLQLADSKIEHPVDAAAVGYCALQSDLLKMVRLK